MRANERADGRSSPDLVGRINGGFSHQPDSGSQGATCRVAATALLVTLVGCNGTSSYLDATGATGAATLGIWMTAIAGAVVFLTCVAILLGIARHRGEHNAPDTEYGGVRDNEDRADRELSPVAAGARARQRGLRHGMRWIYIGTAATIAILIGTFIATMVTMDALSRPPHPPKLTLEVIGHQWWWEVRYHEDGRPDASFITANEVHLPVGQPVRVQLRSADVIHSFWLPQIAGKIDLIPGQQNETWIQAKRPGVSRGMCGEYCGLQHAVMALTVTAEEPSQFEEWLDARRSAQPVLTTATERTGQDVFQQSCSACHAVAGTPALGRIGPDLSDVASRPTIGSGLLDNTPANTALWILNAPALKEGARMPAIPLDSMSLAAVVAYLQTLH